MSAAALLSELRAAGVTLAANGDRLKVQAAPGILTPEITARLKAAKPELMAILTGEAANDEGEARTDDALLADTLELDAIIIRLCDRAGYPDTVRREMQDARRRMNPDNVRGDLPIMRAHLARAEGEAAAAIRRAQAAA